MKPSKVSEKALKELCSQGCNDERIAEVLGVTKNAVKKRRQKLGLSANTRTSGVVNRKILEFGERYRDVIMKDASSKEDSVEVIRLCVNHCPFADETECHFCIDYLKNKYKNEASPDGEVLPFYGVVSGVDSPFHSFPKRLAEWLSTPNPLCV